MKTSLKIALAAGGAVVVLGLGLIPFVFNRAQSAHRSVARGHALAVEYCARCHAVDPNGTSPVADAPPFPTLGQRYPVDDLEESLAEGIMAGHEKYPMPVFQFDADQIHDFIAYLKTIQVPAAKGSAPAKPAAPGDGD